MDMAEIKSKQQQRVENNKKLSATLFKSTRFSPRKTKGRRCKKAENNPQFCLRPLRLLM